MVIKIGRYISPPHIEAQLAPDNYLYTHSLMFTYDCHTQTGINAAIKLNDQWSILFGIHPGDDIAPWNGAAHPSAMAMVSWVSARNNVRLKWKSDLLAISRGARERNVACFSSNRPKVSDIRCHFMTRLMT
jgi:Putative beta-barrel porin-2, OmpL-like. bbp2